MKHSYQIDCQCARCAKERQRRGTQAGNSRISSKIRQRRAVLADSDRTIPEVMLDWDHSRNRRRARIAREYWDAYQSGGPMSSDDY